MTLTILAVISAGIYFLLWLLAMYVAAEIGEPKNRHGLLWGLALGWFGVVIVYMLPIREDI